MENKNLNGYLYEANSLALDLAFDISRLTYYPDTRNEDDFIEILTNHSIKVNILHNQVLQTQSERNFRAATECIQPITAIFEDPEAAISAPINIKEEIPSPAQENNREDDFDQELHKLTNVDQFFLPDAEEIEDQHSEENNSGDDSKVQSGKRKCRDPSKELEDSSFDAYSSSGTSDSDKELDSILDDKVLNDYAKKDLLASSNESSGSCSDSSSCSNVEVLNNFSDTSIKQESSSEPENSCNTPNLPSIRVLDKYFDRSPVSKKRRINLPVKIKKERGSYNYNSNVIALTSDEDDSDFEFPGSQKKSVYERNMAHCRAIKQEDLDADLEEYTKLSNSYSSSTQATLKAERCRVKSVIARNAILDEVVVASDDILLDYDEKSSEQIKIHPRIAEKLMPHQIEGIKHMYDCCYASIQHVRDKYASGCILSHMMGLGKTFQVIALIHTVIRFPQLNTRRCLIICPKSTVTLWRNEIFKWCSAANNRRQVNVFDITGKIANLDIVRKWFQSNINNPGVLLISYDMFRLLVNSKTNPKEIHKLLCHPGADLAVLDEGHRIKNENNQISQAVSRISTKRRIILTGTPVQNNLMEYFSMINFVKPHFLGSLKDFKKNFHTPITNGQSSDSTPRDVVLMRKKSYVLHKKLQPLVQRKDIEDIKDSFPMMREYCIFVPMTEVQESMYELYLKKNPLLENVRFTSKLFEDRHTLAAIWTHPRVVQQRYMKRRNELVKKIEKLSKKQMIVDQEDEDKARLQLFTDLGNYEEKNALVMELVDKMEDLLTDIIYSNKFVVMLEILKKCWEKNEKCLIFSNSLQELDVISFFMRQNSGLQYGNFVEGVDFCCYQGSTSVKDRENMIDGFNNPHGTLRVFLISIKAGGEGINLHGANRCIIMDVCWNPAMDRQAIFRIYRLGQKKPCFIYRFIAMGTMEDHIYSRSVTKEALSRRVVEKQQIKASYTMAELEQLYRYDKPNFEERQQPILPEDDILKHLLNQYADKIFKYHIHSSLLEDKPEDDLSEAEKLAAWVEDERECRQMEALNSNPPLISFGMPEIASTSNAIPPVRPSTSSAPIPASSLLDADQLMSSASAMNGQQLYDDFMM